MRTAFVHHFAFEFRAGLRNPVAMLLYYLFPLGFYLLMGFVMVEINPDFTDLLVPAMVIVTLMAGTLLGLPSQLVDAREAGVYRSFKVNGVPAVSIITIPVLAATVHGVIASAIIAVSAGPFFGVTPPSRWVHFAFITLLSAFTFGATAALIGVVSASTQSTVLWSQLLFLPSMLIGGLMFDLALLPGTVKGFSGLLPSTYAMQAFLGDAFEATPIVDPTASIIVLASGGLVAFGLALLLFDWDRKNASRRFHPALALLSSTPYLVGLLLF